MVRHQKQQEGDKRASIRYRWDLSIRTVQSIRDLQRISFASLAKFGEKGILEKPETRVILVSW